MEKNLEATRKKVEQSTRSTMAEIRKVILIEVSTLEATMRKIYEGFVIVHKANVHLYSFEGQSRNIFQTLRDIHATISHVKEQKMNYKGASLHFPKMMKLQAQLDKEKIQMQIQNYKQLTPFISSIQDSYAWLFKRLDVIVRAHRIPSIYSHIEDNEKNQVQIEIDRYVEKLR